MHMLAVANKKASPPGRHREQASEQRCTFGPTAFSSVQFSSGHYFISSIITFKVQFGLAVSGRCGLERRRCP